MNSPELAFWEWFLAHEEPLYDYELDKESLFDLLHAELQKVDANLAFEFGPREPKRDFVLSAGGIRESFPAVLRLQNTAPLLPRWKLIAFRPRRWPPGTIEMDTHKIRSKDMSFTLFTIDKDIGIRLYMPGYNDDDASMKMIAYLFLDEALGEFDIETKVRFLKFLPTDAPAAGERYPFIELPQQFDELYTEVNGLSGKLS